MRLWIWIPMTVCGLALADAAAAPPEELVASEATPASGLDRLIRDLVLQNAPHEYENDRQWGGTRQVWDGLHVWRDGLRIKTKRRWKDANHGTWKKYRAWLIDPDHQFDVQFLNLHKTAEGKAAFDLLIDAKLGAWGRLSEWRQDVQLFSFSADAEATVRLKLSCELSARLDPSHLPPDLVLQPQVMAADLALVDFRLKRISDADGPLVKQLGKSLREVLEDELRDRQPRLVQRMNDQIRDHQDDLRLSARDLAASGWQQALQLLDPAGGL